jgi:hypothetical protein
MCQTEWCERLQLEDMLTDKHRDSFNRINCLLFNIPTIKLIEVNHGSMRSP